MKKRILAAVCAIFACITSVSFTSPALAERQGQYITYGDLVSANLGNIFYGSEPIVFTMNIINPNIYTVYGRYSYTVTDETGEVVYSDAQQGLPALAAGRKFTRTITLPRIEKYGFYKLNLTEYSNNKNSEADMVSEEFSADFSVCIPLDKSDVNKSFGFNQAIVNNGNPAAVSLMKQVGANWHREDVSWVGVEPNEKEKYIPLTQYRDKLMHMKNDDGIDTVCILNGRNSLYCGKAWKNNGGEWVQVTKMPTTDDAIKAYAKFCAFVARNLKGAVSHYEIYNEWNSTQFNPTYKVDAGADVYAKVLKEAYNAIKAEDPGSTVIGCATAGIDTDFITEVLDAYNGEGKVYMDAISVHCYDFEEENGFPEQDFRTKVEGFKAFLAARNLNIPIWLSEVGFSTYDNPTGGFFVPGCTEDVQLNSMVMLGAVNKVYGLFNKVIQYGLNDRGINKTTIEQNWGVLYDYKSGALKNGAKPAYLGLAAMNYFIGGNAEFTDKTEDTDNRQYAFGFYNRKLNKQVTLLIGGGPGNTGEKTLDLGCKTIEVYDKYGNLTEQRSSEDGSYTITVSSEPVYLVYGSEFAVKKNGRAITDMSGLNGGDSLEVILRETDAAAADQKVIAAQFNGERFIKADSFTVDGKTFSGNITVAEGADRIKIVYWDMDDLTPLCDCYEIN